MDTLKSGAELIAIERVRHCYAEDYTDDHDDSHDRGELSRAAMAYLEAAYGQMWNRKPTDKPPMGWPFDSESWKPSTTLRNLVKAGSLIAAEIDRRIRAGDTE